MSAIRIVEGSASVEIEGDDLDVYGGPHRVLYHARDLIKATLRALEAAGEDDTANAVRAGLERDGWEGLSL